MTRSRIGGRPFKILVASVCLGGLLLGCGKEELKPGSLNGFNNDSHSDPADMVGNRRGPYNSPENKQSSKGIDPDGTGPHGDMEDGARPGINPTTG